MIKILINKEYYILSEKDLDKIFQDILISQNYNLKDNENNILDYFVNNIVEILNNMFIPVDEETEVEEVIQGFKDYLSYLKSI